ncbi:unnamed protein product, partial [Arabidopsis halleri]
KKEKICISRRKRLSQTKKEMTKVSSEKSKKKPAMNDMVFIASMNDDLLHNILLRLPAKSFAFASCVNRSWNSVCNRILSRPKMISAFSRNPDQLVVETNPGSMVDLVVGEDRRFQR